MNGVVFIFFSNSEAWVAAFAFAALFCLARLTTWKGMQFLVSPWSFPDLIGMPLEEGRALLYRVGRKINWKWPSFAFDFAFGILLGIALSVSAGLEKVAVFAQHSFLRYLVFASLFMACFYIVAKMRVLYMKPHIRAALRDHV